MLKDLDDTVSFNDDIVFLNADSANVRCFCDDKSLANVYLNNGNLDN